MKLESGLSSDEAKDRLLNAGIAMSNDISRKVLAKTLGLK